MYQDPYSSQQPYQPQQQPGVAPYPPQQQPGVAPYPPQYPYQPGAMPYPQPGITSYSAPKLKVSEVNRRAHRAMINGIISIGFSIITLFTLLGYAGIITGTFAIIYGFMGLKNARALPNNAGQGRAIAGIVMGCVALFLVIVSFFLRNVIRG